MHERSDCFDSGIGEGSDVTRGYSLTRLSSASIICANDNSVNCCRSTTTGYATISEGLMPSSQRRSIPTPARLRQMWFLDSSEQIIPRHRPNVLSVSNDFRVWMPDNHRKRVCACALAAAPRPIRDRSPTVGSAHRLKRSLRLDGTHSQPHHHTNSQRARLSTPQLHQPDRLLLAPPNITTPQNTHTVQDGLKNKIPTRSRMG